MRQLNRVLEAVAWKEVVISPIGESGTGKDVRARSSAKSRSATKTPTAGRQWAKEHPWTRPD